MSQKLDPAAHRQFLELLLTTSKAALGRNPTGHQVAVIGAYQQQFENALHTLDRAPKRRAVKGQATRRPKAA